MEYTLMDLPYTWNIWLQKGTLVVGHEETKECILGEAFQVSAEWLQFKPQPSTLKMALASGNPDAPIGDESWKHPI
jgi:hypothetical protein